MCRSIKRLRQPAGVEALPDEISEAALQFVRKISGIRHPSQRTSAAFERAVAEIASSSERLLRDLPPLQRPRNPQPDPSSQPAPTQSEEMSR